MADVPAWVLVVNTLAAGGFGLAGTLIVPRGQREARLAEERRANAAAMRDKAEEIFDAIFELEDAAQKQMIAAMQMAVTGTEAEAPMVRNDKIRALAAVYFPNLLPIIDKFEAPAEERRERVGAVVEAMKAGDKRRLDLAGADLLRIRAEQTDILFRNAGLMAQLLRTQLTKDVRPYLPEVAS
jgi:hypothetical protein